MKKIAIILFVLFTALLLINSGCRSVKRNKSHSITTIDSVGQKQKQTTKETTITEKVSTPFVYNPGDLFGDMPNMPNSLTYPVYEFENENFKAIVTIPTGGKAGSIDVKGKDKQLQVPTDKTTVIKEVVNEQEGSKKTTDQNNKSNDKEVKGINPVLQWVVGITALLFVVLLIASRFRK